MSGRSAATARLPSASPKRTASAPTKRGRTAKIKAPKKAAAENRAEVGAGEEARRPPRPPPVRRRSANSSGAASTGRSSSSSSRTGGLTALVAYYWAKLPPTSEWTLPKRAGQCAHRRLQRRADHQSRRFVRREPDARRDAALPARGGDRDRGPPLLLPFRHRPDRPGARRGRQFPRRRRRRGRLDADPAARQEPLPDSPSAPSSARSRR